MGNGRIIFRVVAGGYLAYLGITLIMDSIKDKPDNYLWFMLAGTVFTLLGGFWLIWSIVSHFKGDKTNQVNEEAQDTELDTESDTEAIEAESVERQAIEAEAAETETVDTKEQQEHGIDDKKE